MSDANFLQTLVQLNNFHAARTDQGIQMQLHRFWADELAKPRNADPKRLLRYGFKVYSQCDEDGIIQEIFRRIGTGNRVFVEFGVETGVECNRQAVGRRLERRLARWFAGKRRADPETLRMLRAR